MFDIDKNREFKEKVIDNDFNLEFQSTKIAKYISSLEQENSQLKQQLKDIEEYLESIKDMPDADMYIELGEYKEFKHILDLIHKGSE